MIDHGARAVRKQFPDAVLSLGHVSRRGGGDLERHASHESGRDADVGFYVTNQQGKPIYADHFVRFLGDGTAPSWPGARFDDARNWAFIASIVADGRAHISYLFVASPLRARLLAYAQKIGAPYATRVRASELMAQPRGSLPHDDHFHVRISCPGGMESCVELPTRNLVRAKLLHPRTRTTSRTRPWQTPPSSSPLPTFATRNPGAAETGRRPARKRRAPVPSEDLPAIPEAPASPEPSEAPPPAALDAPIDDVDGIEE